MDCSSNEVELPHMELRVDLVSPHAVTMSLSACSLSESGKVAVEYNHAAEEPTDSLTEEELEGLVQVTAADIQHLHSICESGNPSEVTVG